MFNVQKLFVTKLIYVLAQLDILIIIIWRVTHFVQDKSNNHATVWSISTFRENYL